MIRSAILGLWHVALLALVCSSAGAQPRYDLAPDAYDVFRKWMTSSCVGDEATRLRDSLLRYRAELAPAFARALADGPPAAEVRAVREAAAARYAAQANFPLGRYRIEGVDAEALARFARRSQDSYVDDEVQRYVTGYKSNAIAGLGIVGGAQARETLARLAARRGDPLAQAAAEALKTLDRQ